MTTIAGIDVGNSTTEIVIARTDEGRLDIVCSGTATTEGTKGSPQSLRRAARLLEQLERKHDVATEIVAMARFQPVVTDLVELPLVAPTGGRLVSVPTPALTPSGQGLAVGRHTSLEELPERTDEPIVVSVPPDVDFADAAARINAAVHDGLTITGVLCEADEAVLIGNRLARPVPVLDEAALSQFLPGELVLFEIGGPGGHVQTLADPVALTRCAGLPADAVGEAVEIAAQSAESRVALIRRRENRPHDKASAGSAWVEHEVEGGLRRLALGGELGALAEIAPGSVRALQLPSRDRTAKGGAPDSTVRDLFAPDLPHIVRQPLVRRGSVHLCRVPLSLLRDGDERLSSPRRLSRHLGRPVVVETNEALAAHHGAMTTPGAPCSSLVCDIGAGTINVAHEAGSVTVAGSGDLLTLAAASVLGISVPLAERVKRYTSVKALTPHLLHDESGDQRFADRMVAGHAVGMLCAETPTSLLPFGVNLAPEEWRSLRLTLKTAVIGANLERALRALSQTPVALLLCGGGALDNEVVRSVSDALSERSCAVGRADIAGSLGPRYAVAFGLVLTHLHSSLGTKTKLAIRGDGRIHRRS